MYNNCFISYWGKNNIKRINIKKILSIVNLCYQNVSIYNILKYNKENKNGGIKKWN